MTVSIRNEERDAVGLRDPVYVGTGVPAGGSPQRSFDLSCFDLSDMIECGRAIRDVSDGASTMEAAADAIVRMLYSSLRDGETGEASCALLRCFSTRRFAALPQALAQTVRSQMAEPDEIPPQMPCLTMLATAGERPEWNDRRKSAKHAVIPLVSVQIVERAPMIAALIQQMGLKIESAMYPDAQLILDAEQHAFNVFHVEQALGAAAIPGQDKFVKPYRIQSVLGFGGLMPSGELFAIIMFSRTRIPRETADLFRTIALGVKLALLPFTRGPVFEEDRAEHMARSYSDGAASFEDEQLRSEIATLRLLIPALERAALYQTERLKSAMADTKRQAEQGRQQGLRLTAMLEATNDAVFLLDRTWCFTFLNGQAQTLIGAGRDLLGSNIWKEFPDAVGNEFWRQYQRVMNEGVSVQFQEYYPAPLDKWFEVHAFPSADGMAAFFRDVTMRLKTDAQLRQTEKLAATGRMAASIAHEINNPLESVTNLLYLLAADGTMGDESKGYVLQAERELQRVAEITTHMLRFHRQSTKPSDVDMVEVLNSVLVLFHGRQMQAGVTVERRFRGTAVLRGFGGELRQVFANLVGNAIDASRQGGRLLIRAVETIGPDGRAGVRVTIADTGSGMDPETKQRLFEAFFTTKGATGTGLGLWVSAELIQKHGGTVRVRSSVDERHRGTVFSVFLPHGMEPVEDSRGAVT